jgi:hypothetical protein
MIKLARMYGGKASPLIHLYLFVSFFLLVYSLSQHNRHSRKID